MTHVLCSDMITKLFTVFTSSTAHVMIISRQKVTDFGPKWSFCQINCDIICIFDLFDLFRPLEGRLGHQFRVRVSGGALWGGGRVKLRFSIFVGPLCNGKVTDFGPKWSFLLIFTVFDLSRPPEGHYDPCVVLRHDNQVVYGVSQLSSTCNDNITPKSNGFWSKTEK